MLAYITGCAVDEFWEVLYFQLWHSYQTCSFEVLDTLKGKAIQFGINSFEFWCHWTIKRVLLNANFIKICF